MSFSQQFIQLKYKLCTNTYAQKDWSYNTGLLHWKSTFKNFLSAVTRISIITSNPGMELELDYMVTSTLFYKSTREEVISIFLRHECSEIFDSTLVKTSICMNTLRCNNVEELFVNILEPILESCSGSKDKDWFCISRVEKLS